MLNLHPLIAASQTLLASAPKQKSLLDLATQSFPGMVFWVLVLLVGFSVLCWYIIGFQYTLSDSEFQALEPLFEAERDPIIAQAFQNAAEKARIH